VQAALQTAAGSGAEVTPLGTPAGTNASPLRADVVAAVTRALHVRYPGVPVVPMQESGLSDALYTRSIGIPTYGVSAGFIKDTDNHMHGSNEGIPVTSFYDYLDFWYALITDLATRR
jgi:acetylornithine deacetylase/succinyl-diaminopimelate desuccinylase-like protein